MKVHYLNGYLTSCKHEIIDKRYLTRVPNNITCLNCLRALEKKYTKEKKFYRGKEREIIGIILNLQGL